MPMVRMFEILIVTLALFFQESAEMKSVDPRTQARLEALLEAAGIGKLSTTDGKAFADPEVLRKLTSSVSCALDEAAAALTRMRAETQPNTAQNDRYGLCSRVSNCGILSYPTIGGTMYMYYGSGQNCQLHCSFDAPPSY